MNPNELKCIIDQLSGADISNVSREGIYVKWRSIYCELAQRYLSAKYTKSQIMEAISRTGSGFKRSNRKNFEKYSECPEFLFDFNLALDFVKGNLGIVDKVNTSAEDLSDLLGTDIVSGILRLETDKVSVLKTRLSAILKMI